MRDRAFCAALLLIASVVEAGDRHDPPRYRIEKLEGINGFPTDINRHGAITGQGFSLSNPSESFPYLWTRKRSTILTAEPPTVPISGLAVNDKRQVAGNLVAFDPPRTAGYVWTRGRFREIGDLPGGNNFSSADNINNFGQVVGSSDSALGTECILWERGNLMSIGDLPGGDVSCSGLAINRSGVAVGFGRTDQGFRPFIWREGTMTELPLPPEATSGFASDINRRGDVIGGFSVGDELGGALVWSNGERALLPGLPGLVPFVRGINDRGDIVGSVGDRTGFEVPVLWRNRVPINLNELIPADDPLKSCTRLDVADAINNSGMIAVFGVDVCVTPSPLSTYRLVPLSGRVGRE